MKGFDNFRGRPGLNGTKIAVEILETEPNQPKSGRALINRRGAIGLISRARPQCSLNQADTSTPPSDYRAVGCEHRLRPIPSSKGQDQRSSSLSARSWLLYMH